MKGDLIYDISDIIHGFNFALNLEHYQVKQVNCAGVEQVYR